MNAAPGRMEPGFGTGAAALALGLALALGAGEAAAQNLCAGDVVTGRTTIVVCDRGASETRDVHINLRNPDIALTGHNESPITADTYGMGSVTIEVTGGSLSSSGNWAKGIRSWSSGGSGDVAVTVKDVDITTANDNGNAVYVRRQAGTGNIRIDVSGGVLTTTGGGVSQGITGWVQVAGDIDIDAKDVVMRTEGANSLGIFGYQQGPTGDVDVAVQGGSIETNGFLAHGVYSGKIGGTGNAGLSVSGAAVTTRGRFTRAVNGVSSGEGDVTVDVSGEAVIVAEGEGSVGVYLLHAGNGSVHATVGAETRTAAPFANGVYGRLMPSANAAGRIVIDARGRIEARNAGILAWAEPRSGSTFGEGNEAADETAGTTPMIHVTSSGDVTVGEGVMDAYVRAAVAGDDGTLQAGEQAVLNAIEGDDSDALDTALGALPDDYDDAWKARMRAFRAARGAERTDHHGSQGNAPGANARLAEEAAVEILDIPRAGIRAMALSHTEIADYVRRGGLGGSLSDDERTVLAAVLTGGDLEAALAALPAAYTDNWKDGVRLRAMSYNAGDIQVDVTGGTITSEGDGVHARYVVPHDRNGAIAVSVAEGASVAGGRHGIFVGGAGLDDDGLRDQTVTVNGAVMGGTGAGVHLAGGGTVTVGRTGRVGATSGDAVRSDGASDLTLNVMAGGIVTGAIGNEAGDLSVTVAGKVESDDLRAPAGGALTLNVMEGGAVTGTVHDPVGPLTVAGSIGRLLYGNGGTVTVARTGRLTGIEGETEALRSESGDLDVTVAGSVAGDLRAPSGGALTLNVMEGGEVTGTVHDPAGPLTVAGSIGRLLYGNGGTVTVARTGRLTGIEGETEALRSESRDLDVTVAGTVAGDIRAPSGGALTLNVMEGGAVTGTVHDPVGPLTVRGSIGRLLYGNGGTVTVAATGKLTGIEGEALRSAAGDLDVTVAGTVTGDVIEEGDGDLSATISGAVEGNVFGRGAGEHTVTVAAGGTVTGVIHLSASTVRVDGAAGRVQFDEGGTVTVGGAGQVTGIEGVAVRNAAGALSVTVATGGRIEGNVIDLGDRPARITVEAGSAVTGTIDVAGKGSAVTVDGTVGRVRLDDGGMVAIGEDGRVTDEGEAIASAQGDLTVVIDRGSEETQAAALVRGVRGKIVERGGDGVPAILIGEEGEDARPVGAPGTAASAPDGAYDLGVVADEDGVRLRPAYAPRARVYEALPSVLLGLNGLPSADERLAAARGPRGTWGLLEVARGSRKAAESETGAGYDHRRYGVRAGVELPVGEDGSALGFSLHHRRGSASVPRGGTIEVQGTGMGVYGMWRRGRLYVDAEAAATRYEAALESASRGRLAEEVSSIGHALGLEAGHRFALRVPGAGEVTVTPRARLVRSAVSAPDFTDSVDARVSLDKSRRLTGRAGVAVESATLGDEGRLFGSVDVERAFERETRVSVSGTSLASKAEATRYLIGLGGVRDWSGGRYTVSGKVGYAAIGGGSREYGGGVSLTVRF